MKSFIIVDWKGGLHFAKYLHKGAYVPEYDQHEIYLWQFDLHRQVTRLMEDVFRPDQYADAMRIAEQRQLEWADAHE